MFKSIENKLIKELHKTNIKYIFDSIYNCNIAILNTDTGLYLSSHRFFKLYNGLVPFDKDTNELYKKEKEVINSIISNKWQKIRIDIDFKYFNILKSC